MLSTLAYGLDKVACVIPACPLYQGRHYIAAQPFAVTHDGVVRLLTKVVYEVNTEINAPQLLEERVDGREKDFTLAGLCDDGVNHLMVPVHHVLKLLPITLIPLQGQF